MMSASKSKILNFNRKAKDERDYWAERLSSVRGFLHLRPDRSARSDDSETQRIEFTFPSDLLVSLAGVTHNSQLLLYATLLAALKVCLYRYTGKHDIVVGSPPRRVKENSPLPANALAIIDQIDGSNS